MPVYTPSFEEEALFECVKEDADGKKRMVTNTDCFYCRDREGCPNA